jgi:hypothetical protein
VNPKEWSAYGVEVPLVLEEDGQEAGPETVCSYGTFQIPFIDPPWATRRGFPLLGPECLLIVYR